MKKYLQISTSIDKPELLKDLVEKLAFRRNDTHAVPNLIPLPWQAIETSSLESYINGTMNIEIGDGEAMHVPYTSNFLFSCKREKNNPYKFNWGLSLS